MGPGQGYGGPPVMGPRPGGPMPMGGGPMRGPMPGQMGPGMGRYRPYAYPRRQMSYPPNGPPMEVSQCANDFIS